MKKILKIWLDEFQKQFFVLPNSNLLLAVSGGQDSLSLLYLIWLLQQQWQFINKSIYYNHLWSLIALASQYQIMLIHYALRSPVCLIFPFESTKLTSETGARYWRYTIFQRIACMANIDCIVTGHTQTDRIESFIFNLINGTGSYGSISLTSKRHNYQPKFACFTETRLNFNKVNLKPSVQFERQINPYKLSYLINIYRPLLFLNRYEIKFFINLTQFPIWTDKSNFKLQYLRNKIRLQILPFVRVHFNPKVDIALTKYLNICTQETNFIQNLATKNFFQNGAISRSISNEDNFVILDISIFLSIPLIIQKRIVLQVLKSYYKKRFSYIAINLILKTIFIGIKLTAIHPDRSQSFLFSETLLITCSKNNVYLKFNN